MNPSLLAKLVENQLKMWFKLRGMFQMVCFPGHKQNFPILSKCPGMIQVCKVWVSNASRWHWNNCREFTLMFIEHLAPHRSSTPDQPAEGWLSCAWLVLPCGWMHWHWTRTSLSLSLGNTKKSKGFPRNWPPSRQRETTVKNISYSLQGSMAKWVPSRQSFWK